MDVLIRSWSYPKTKVHVLYWDSKFLGAYTYLGNICFALDHLNPKSTIEVSVSAPDTN